MHGSKRGIFFVRKCLESSTIDSPFLPLQGRLSSILNRPQSGLFRILELSLHLLCERSSFPSTDTDYTRRESLLPGEVAQKA